MILFLFFQAQAIVAEYDLDGGGTIDFTEFMILIYKIQRGTINLANNDLAQILMESKAKLKIFEVSFFSFPGGFFALFF